MSKKGKIYLAKSNKANPNIVAKVRQIISNYDVELLEYSGGAYSNVDLRLCDVLFVVPDLSRDILNGITVGKGLFQQITYFNSCNNIDNVQVVLNDNLEIGKIYGMDEFDDDDFINYGNLDMHRTTEKITYSLDRHFNKKTSKKVTKKYYILIGNS